MRSEKSLGVVLERELRRIHDSPRVQRWARARLEDLAHLDGAAIAIAGLVGLGVVFTVCGYAGSADGLRELLEELAGDQGKGDANGRA